MEKKDYKTSEDYELDEKINLLYEYTYNINTKEEFIIDKITLGKIGLEDIKFKLDSENYDKNKTDILNGQFKLIRYDDNEKLILFKKYSNQFPVTVKISFYSDKTDNMNNKINNDSLFSYILSSLVLSKKTKHILLPIINLDTNLSEIDKLIKNDTCLCYNNIKKAIDNNEIKEECCLQVREHFFRTTNLEDYFKENQCSYKPLLFQILHTLATIQKEYNGFSHNNLLLKNVGIYLKKQNNNYTEYEGFKNDKFYVPNPGFDVKITNFEYSSIPKFYENKSTKNQFNSYYDIFTFLNDMLEGTTKMSIYSNKCDKETIKFFDKVIPKELRGKLFNNNNNNNFNSTDLLYDSYFNEYLEKPKNNLPEESLTNHVYLTGKINTYMDSDNYSTLGNQNKLISNNNIMNNNSNKPAFKGNKKNTIHNSEDQKLELDINYRTIKLEKNTEKKLTRVQKGGFNKPELAPYKNEKNNPFTTNERKDINKKRYDENPIKEPPVLLEQKIYDRQPVPPQKQQFPPSFIPIYDESGGVTNNMLPYSKVINQPPIQKIYNVTLANPLGNYTTLNRIYEDMLPGQPFTLSSLTIYERLQLIEYLRNNMLTNMDGEEMNVTGGDNSMLSYIKVLDLNPYTMNANPISMLSKDFILYRAAYPIRFDDKTKSIAIAKNNMGMNIRMYKLSQGALMARQINQNINVQNFDVWREVMYYNWVKTDILKKKISPNFIAPILYKIDTQSNISWERLEEIKKGRSTYALQQNDDEKTINALHTLDRQLGPFAALLPRKLAKPEQQPKADITVNSNKTLILLTEAPTTSLITWSSTVYESYGSKKLMVATGYHSLEIWKVILFQLIYIFAILQKHNIFMVNILLEKNFLIKDIFSDINAIGSWIYKIDNIDYYIPNYGYILQFDSAYSEPDQFVELATRQPIPPTDHQYKIKGKLFDSNNYKSQIMDQFKSIINPDNFSHMLTLKGASKPDDNIITILKNIRETINNENIQDINKIIPLFFGEFIHNRVGSLLLKSEKDNINMLSRPNFRKGNLMIWQERYQEFKWVIYVEPIQNSLKHKIITRINDKNEITEVFANTLFSYPENETVLPDSTKKFKYDENHIYETYIFD
jgi:hypothetical protein